MYFTFVRRSVVHSNQSHSQLKRGAFLELRLAINILYTHCTQTRTVVLVGVFAPCIDTRLKYAAFYGLRRHITHDANRHKTTEEALPSGIHVYYTRIAQCGVRLDVRRRRRAQRDV